MPLHIAISEGKPEIVRKLLEFGASTQACGYYTEAGYNSMERYHPLFAAINAGWDDVVSLMLDKGVNFLETVYRWNEDFPDDMQCSMLGEEVYSSTAAHAMLIRLGKDELLKELSTYESTDSIGFVVTTSDCGNPASPKYDPHLHRAATNAVHQIYRLEAEIQKLRQQLEAQPA